MQSKFLSTKIKKIRSVEERKKKLSSYDVCVEINVIHVIQLIAKKAELN